MAQPEKVALGQIRPVLGDVAENIEKHLKWMKQAKSQGASLIVFPELGLTGYQVQDLTLDVARPLTHPDVAELVDASRNIDVVFSLVEESDEHLFFLSSVYAAGGVIQSVHRKVYLPTYGMFDEGRYLAAGSSFQTFSSRFGKIGMMVCEDAWHMSSPYLLSLGGARIILVPAASPARSVHEAERFGSQSFWRDLVRVYAQLFGVYVVFVNRVGFEDGINFFGGSAVSSPSGEWVVEGPNLDEALILTELDLGAVRRARYTTPILRDEKTHVVMREMQRILSDKE